jgi:hypothetical protein
VLPNNLQWGIIGTQSPAYCALHEAEDGQPFDPNYEFCAIDPTNEAISTCHGDSGGPAVVAPTSSSLIEVGIIDRADPNCDTTVPDIFTRVDLVEPWVAAEITAVAPPPVAPPVAAPPTTPVVTVTVTPATTTTPASTAPAALAAATQGKYTGTSSQARGHVNVTVGANGITRLSLQFNLRCSRGKRLRPYTTTLTDADETMPIKLLAANSAWTFTDRFTDTANARYSLTGTFPATGSATGTLSVVSHNHVCSTGLVQWAASLPT